MLLKQSLGLSILIQLSTAAVIPRGLDHAGEFAIVDCGTQNTVLLKTLLGELSGVLTPASQDAESTQGVAYQAFFKDAEQGASVSNLLANIAQGAPIFPADQFTEGAPGFLCLSGMGQFTGTMATTGAPFDAFDFCVDPTTAFELPGTKWIVLCPLFFTSPVLIDSPPAPPADNQPAPNCLNTSMTRLGDQFAGSADDRHGATQLAEFKVWVLLHELAHAYINAAYGIDNNDKKALDVYDANAVFFLSADQSVLNAANYVLYVASLYGKCTAFPTLTGRKLLDVKDDLAAYQTAAEINTAAVLSFSVQYITVNVS